MFSSMVFYFAITLTTRALDNNGSNVCRRQNDGREELYCCYNHQEINNECQECQTGTLSEHGEECTLCKEGRFGYGCLKKCLCEEQEICDPVYGCMELFVSLATDNNTGNTNLGQTHFSTIKPISTSVIITGQTYFSTIKPISTSVIITDKSVNVIQNYIIGIGGAIGFLLICIILLQIVNKQKRSSAHNINEAEQNSHPDTHFNESVYDEIDEVSTPDSTHARNSYLSVIDSKSITGESEGSCCIVSISADVPVNPYEHTTPEYENQLHKYDTSLAVNKEPISMEQKEKQPHINAHYVVDQTHCVDDAKECVVVGTDRVVVGTDRVGDAEGTHRLGDAEVEHAVADNKGAHRVGDIEGTLSVCDEMEYNDGYSI